MDRLTLQSETEIVEQIDLIKKDYQDCEVKSDYRVNCSGGWYVNEKADYPFVRSELIEFIKNGLVVKRLMWFVRYLGNKQWKFEIDIFDIDC